MRNDNYLYTTFPPLLSSLFPFAAFFFGRPEADSRQFARPADAQVGDGPRLKGKAMAIYCPKERAPYILERAHKSEDAKLWRITDNRQLEFVGDRKIPKDAKVYPVAIKTPENQIELFILYVAKEPKVDKEEGSKSKRGIVGCLYIPREGIEEPWHEVARHSIEARDTKLLILYIPGKQEPMAMSLSASTKTACLCKLNLTNCLPPVGRSAKDMELARLPVVEAVSDRRLADVFAKHPLEQDVWQVRPTDCTADLLVSKGHPWVTAELVVTAAAPAVPRPSSPGSPLRQDDFAARPTFEPRPVFEPRAPFEPRALAPNFDPRPVFEPRPVFDPRPPPTPYFEPRGPSLFEPRGVSPFEPRGPMMSSPFDVQIRGPAPSPFVETLGPRMPFMDPALLRPMLPAPRGFEAPAARGPPMNRSEGPAVGDLVEINWQEKNMWFPGVVTHVHDDSTYDVEYEDGTMEHNVRTYCIRGRGLGILDHDMNMLGDMKGGDLLFYKGEKKGKGKGKGFDFKGKGDKGEFKGDFKGKGKGKKGKDFPWTNPSLQLRGADRFASWDGPKTAICVDNEIIGLIIGSGGETIRRLEEETHAKITVAKDSTCAPGDNKRMIYVTGDTEEIVEDARKKVCDIRDGATKRKPAPMESRGDRRDDTPREAGKDRRRRSPRRGRSNTRRKRTRSRHRRSISSRSHSRRSRRSGRRSRSRRSRSAGRKRSRSNNRDRSPNKRDRSPNKRDRSSGKRDRSPNKPDRSSNKRDRSSKRKEDKSRRRSHSRKEKKRAKKASKKHRRKSSSSRSSSAASMASRSKRRARGLQAAILEETEKDVNTKEKKDKSK
eukprot:GEMP01004326.1.p1 GENE.GEMP01004326.1~~GEMP01004326.1.p1  ORF type:complete len:830 (+),score=202.96 GEMP01004326.1:944-3433(+)